MKRVTENPPERFPEGKPLDANEHPWWAVKVKPRQEKALADDFMQQGIEYYLPLYTKVSRRPDNNKPRKSILPLFPGYMAFCAQTGTQQSIFTTGRVVSVLLVKHQKRFVQELMAVEQGMRFGYLIEPISEYEPGKPVKVIGGPLQGVFGTITRVNGEDKVVLSVEGLGRAAVTVESRFVELLKDCDDE